MMLMNPGELKGRSKKACAMKSQGTSPAQYHVGSMSIREFLSTGDGI